MTSGTEEQVRTALRRATDDLEVRPGLQADVRRGGRRRLVRRRVALLATVAVLLAGAGTVTTRAAGDLLRADTAATSVFARPTRGDLAGDRQYVDGVLAAWRRFVTGSTNPIEDAQPAGDPHVLFAGATPAGRAAAVAQRVEIDVDKNGVTETARSTLLGLVETGADGSPTVTLIKIVEPSWSDVVTFLVKDRVLVVLPGTEMSMALSTERAYRSDGTVQREFRQLTFTDGVAITEVPSQRLRNTLILVRTPTGPVDPANLQLDAVVDTSPDIRTDGTQQEIERARTEARAGRVLPWANARMPFGGGRWAAGDALTEELLVHGTNALAPYEDRGCGHYLPMSEPYPPLGRGSVVVFGEPWFGYGGTPDGRTVSVRELQYDDEPGRIFAVLTGADPRAGTVVFGGFVDPAAPLPVRVELPDGQGWVVAAHGATLRYQRGTDTVRWFDAGHDAALLPADATTVSVERPGNAPVPVRLR